jgi:hypothetical protein
MVGQIGASTVDGAKPRLALLDNSGTACMSLEDSSSSQRLKTCTLRDGARACYKFDQNAVA